jgi:hypothetical protein
MAAAPAATSARRLFSSGLAEARAKPAPPFKRHRKRCRGLRLGLPLALVFSAALLAGCGSSSKHASPTTTASWEGAPGTGGSDKQVVASFNEYLKDRPGSASPTQLALEYVRADRQQVALTTTQAEASPEGGGPTTVTVVLDGLPDDSVRATRDVLRFVPDGSGWRLESAVRTQRCQPGRGHADFEAGDCV